MTFHEGGLVSLVPVMWIISLYFLIKLALRRVEPEYRMKDWQYETQMRQIKPRGNVITLYKIYSKVLRSTPRQIAVEVRDELSSNAAMLYRKPNAFFVKYRSDDKVMNQYFHDKELRQFFKDPRQWANLNGGVKTKLWGLIRIENEPSPDYYDNLNRIVRKFEDEIAGAKAPKLQ